MLFCAAASTLAYVLLTQKNDGTVNSSDETKSQTGGSAEKELTDKTFKNALKDAKNNGTILFIDLYAPWCGYCQNLAPIWKNLESEVKNDSGLNEKVKIYKIDADGQPMAKKHFNVESFPTIVLYNGKTDRFYKYGKNEAAEKRTVPDFMKYINKHL